MEIRDPVDFIYTREELPPQRDGRRNRKHVNSLLSTTRGIPSRSRDESSKVQELVGSLPRMVVNEHVASYNGFRQPPSLNVDFSALIYS